MGARSFDEDSSAILVNAVNDAILIRQAVRITSLKIADQFLPGVRLDGNDLLKDRPKFFAEFRRQPGDILGRLAGDPYLAPAHLSFPEHLFHRECPSLLDFFSGLPELAKEARG